MAIYTPNDPLVEVDAIELVPHLVDLGVNGSTLNHCFNALP